MIKFFSFLLKAGRVTSFDELAQKFFAAAASSRQTILDEARTLAKNTSDGADHYLKVMEKVVAKGEGYIAKETKRYVPPPSPPFFHFRHVVPVKLIGFSAEFQARLSYGKGHSGAIQR